jgi:hypothetical protein
LRSRNRKDMNLNTSISAGARMIKAHSNCVISSWR